MTKQEILSQIVLMKNYATMMLEREDWHGLWDAAIDLQRLTDRLNHIADLGKKECECESCKFKDKKIELLRQEVNYYYDQMRKYEIKNE